MRKWIDMGIIAAVIAFVLAVFSRALIQPVFGLGANALAGFAAICLLFTIALTLMEILKIQEKK